MLLEEGIVGEWEEQESLPQWIGHHETTQQSTYCRLLIFVRDWKSLLSQNGILRTYSQVAHCWQDACSLSKTPHAATPPRPCRNAEQGSHSPRSQAWQCHAETQLQRRRIVCNYRFWTGHSRWRAPLSLLPLRHSRLPLSINCEPS